MCIRCEKRSKRLGPSKVLTFGQVKFYAHRMLRGESIPFFDYKTNIAIEAHISRINRAMTHRRRGIA